MKSIIKAGTSVVKGNITNIIVSSDTLNLVFDSSLNITFEKKNYNEQVFMNFMNLLKNVNVNAKGIFYINVPRGTIEQVDTTRSNDEYNSIGGVTETASGANVASKPLIDGVFTQEPQGPVEKMNRDVIEQYKQSIKSSGATQTQATPATASRGKKKEVK